MSYSQYCTAADIDLLLSSAGVRSFADHDDDGLVDDNILSEMIDQASAEVAAYVLRRYTDAVAADSSLVKRWTVILAARQICMLRGNGVPQSIEAEFERLTAPGDGLLAQVQDGKFKLPGALIKSRGVPTFSNLTMDRRRVREKVRVTEDNSDNIDTSRERDSAHEVISHG